MALFTDYIKFMRQKKMENLIKDNPKICGETHMQYLKTTSFQKKDGE